ncbi:hypothetical protein HHI36_017623 [Cryptolaemus montrouzieri]|uniref:Uncharacterized protein n=1 Tax=Cryptolaemus montrouzieri TaxID=559131 RepID=A0ABD2NNF2_9CUCU
MVLVQEMRITDFERWLNFIAEMSVLQENIPIFNSRIIGLHFFEENLNSAIYLNFLENDLPLYSENVALQERIEMWFHQDGTPPHNAEIVTTFLNNVTSSIRAGGGYFKQLL